MKLIGRAPKVIVWTRRPRFNAGGNRNGRSSGTGPAGEGGAAGAEASCSCSGRAVVSVATEEASWHRGAADVALRPGGTRLAPTPAVR